MGAMTRRLQVFGLEPAFSISSHNPRSKNWSWWACVIFYRRLAAIANVVNPSAVLEMREVQTAASALDLEITTFEMRRPEDIATAFEALRGHAEALMSVPTRS
jgi:hypothetical protein